jgi:hemolysin activation/secretion protein
MRKQYILLTLILSPIVLSCFFSHTKTALAQNTTERRRQVPPALLGDRPFQSPPTKSLPAVPPVPRSENQPSEATKVFIREIQITGSTVFSPEDLAKITAPYLNRELAPEDFEEIRRALTLHYVNHGYINSGAIIPEQEVVGGAIHIQIVEGQLNKITVEERNRLRPSYITKRIALDAGPPLNIYRLQERLQILQQDPRIEQINGELKPGVRRGESELNVRIKERTPYQAGLRFNNYEPPSVGSVKGEAFFSCQNVTGFGDTLSLIYDRTEGINPSFDASYSLPFTPRDTQAIFHYQRTELKVVEKPFEPLDIKSKFEVWGLTLRHPFYKTLYHELALAVTGERLHNETSLLGEPFSFTLGAENGKSTVTALRIAPEWIYRTQTHVLAMRSRFSFGLHALDATISQNKDVPDSDFFSWLGQFQWAKRFEKTEIETSFRFDAQLSNRPLLPVEQIAVGGRYTVRGYRENQMVRDNGLVASFETRVPIVRHQPWADYVQLAPFVDYGRAWNNDTDSGEQNYIASVGVGLRWAITFKRPFRWQPQFEIYWGRRLKHVPNPHDDLQDSGIHAQIVVATF